MVKFYNYGSTSKFPSLDYLANKYNTDKGTLYSGPSKHGYAPFYDIILKHLRNEPIRMLEIGVCMEGTIGGHSIRMWSDYFINAEIYTFDIVDMSNNSAITENNRVSFYRGDQGNRNDFLKMYESFGNKNFDFILEDGSHTTQHQMISLGCLFKYIKPGSFYILEDISIPGQNVCCIRNDKTYETIINFINTNKFQSEYLTDEEKTYLEDNIENIEIYEDVQRAYATAILYKYDK